MKGHALVQDQGHTQFRVSALDGLKSDHCLEYSGSIPLVFGPPAHLSKCNQDSKAIYGRGRARSIFKGNRPIDLR